MNVSVNIDCTPQEARQFFGLPDLTSLHEAYIEKFRSTVETGITPETIRTMMETWGPMGETGFNLWKQFVSQAGSNIGR